MKKGFDWDKAIDNIQFAMLWFVIAVIVICVLVLILFDVVGGAGVMMVLTRNSGWTSLFISLATSGLLISLMFIGYTFSSNKNKGVASFGWIIGVISLLVYFVDVYFDSLTADYLRFGQIMVLKDIPNPNIQILFRCLLGGISTVGESLAMAIILGMPVLKEIINKAIPDSLKKPYTEQHHQPKVQHSTYVPKNKPQLGALTTRQQMFREQKQTPENIRRVLHQIEEEKTRPVSEWGG